MGRSTHELAQIRQEDDVVRFSSCPQTKPHTQRGETSDFEEDDDDQDQPERYLHMCNFLISIIIFLTIGVLRIHRRNFDLADWIIRSSDLIL